VSFIFGQVCWACLPILLIRPFFIRLNAKNPKAVALYDRSSLLLIGLFLLGCANFHKTLESIIQVLIAKPVKLKVICFF
jgi:hypothetical protein